MLFKYNLIHSVKDQSLTNYNPITFAQMPIGLVSNNSKYLVWKLYSNVSDFKDKVLLLWQDCQSCDSYFFKDISFYLFCNWEVKIKVCRQKCQWFCHRLIALGKDKNNSNYICYSIRVMHWYILFLYIDMLCRKKMYIKH